MGDSTRREFLQTSAALLASAFAGTSFDIKKNQHLLSFSTLACPDWTFQHIADFAAQHNYSGIEIRGIQHEMDLTKCKEFSNTQNRSTTLKLLRGKGLEIVGLGSSASLHFASADVRKINLDEARLFIDLAQQVKCPYVRVFPNIFPKDQDKNATMDLMIKGLLELGDYAKERNVCVLMETHGEMLRIEDIENLMKSAEHPHTGLVWDVANMWTKTKEPPADVYRRLKKYIRHTHLKDAKLVDGKLQYVLLGQGEVPVFEAIDALVKGGYKGYYSFEWEKLWHPEIQEPEVALADYSKVMKQFFL